MSESIEAAEAILATVTAARARITQLAHANLSFSRALALELRATVGASPERLAHELMHDALNRRLGMWSNARAAAPAVAAPAVAAPYAPPPVAAPPLVTVTPAPAPRAEPEEDVDDEVTPVTLELVGASEPSTLPQLFAASHADEDEQDEHTAEAVADQATFEGTRESAPAPIDLVRITAPALPEPSLVRFAEPSYVRIVEPQRPYEEPSGPVTVEPGELVFLNEDDSAEHLVRFSEPRRAVADAGVENVFDELDDELLQEALADALGEEPSDHGSRPLGRFLEPDEDDDLLDDDEDADQAGDDDEDDGNEVEDDTDDDSGDNPTDVGELLPSQIASPEPPRQPAATTTPPVLQFIQPTTSIDDEPTYFAGPRQVQPRPIIDEEPARRTATVQLTSSRARQPESNADLEAAPDEDSYPGAQQGQGFSVVLERPETPHTDGDSDVYDEDESAPVQPSGPRLTDEDDVSQGAETLPNAPAAARPDPGLVGDFLRKAQEALERADLNNAILYFRDLLDVDGDNVEGYLGRGRCLVELGDYAAAMSDFQRSEDLDPKSPEPLVEMGNLFFARKEYRRAIEFYDQAIELDRNHAMAHCRRGICQHYRKNYDAAIKDLQRAQRLDANIPNITKYVKMAVKASMTRPR